MTAVDRESNLLGALALVITDQTVAAAATSGLSLSAAAALSAMHHFLERPTLDRIGQVLGLTHSGAVRLVDRLVAAGLVTRVAGADGRSRAVVLTPAGRGAAARLSAARADVLGAAMADLSPAERDTLHALMSRLMTAIVHRKDGGAWICRLCDLGACGRDAGLCPTANAAAARWADRRKSGETS